MNLYLRRWVQQSWFRDFKFETKLYNKTCTQICWYLQMLKFSCWSRRLLVYIMISFKQELQQCKYLKKKFNPPLWGSLTKDLPWIIDTFHQKKLIWKEMLFELQQSQVLISTIKESLLIGVSIKQ